MKCCGCGVKLQFSDPSKIGYTPVKDAESYQEEIYCERCYKIIHHSIDFKPALSNNEYYNKIDVLKDKKCLIVLIVDALNIPSSFIPNLDIHIKDNPVLVLVNKCDILPKDLTLQAIEKFTKGIASKNNLNVCGLSFISSLKDKNLDKVVDKISKIKYNYFKKYHKEIIDTYVLGAASTGKSTFINHLKKLYGKNTTDLTTSIVPQTTLDFVKIGIDAKNYLFDTPGFINYHSYNAYLAKSSLEMITPKSYIKPKTYQLNGNQTIFLGGLVRLDIECANKMNVSIYAANPLYVHRTKTEKADEIYNNNIITLLNPPMNEEEFNNIKEMKQSVYHLKDKRDLFIAGIGFIHFVGQAKVTVHVYKEINMTVTESII